MSTTEETGTDWEKIKAEADARKRDRARMYSAQLKALKVGDRVTVCRPQFYSSNVQFWEMSPCPAEVVGVTHRGNLKIRTHRLLPAEVYSILSGDCISHRLHKGAPSQFNRSKIRRNF